MLSVKSGFGNVTFVTLIYICMHIHIYACTYVLSTLWKTSIFLCSVSLGKAFVQGLVWVKKLHKQNTQMIVWG